MFDVPPQEVPVNRAYEESEVEYLLALCKRMAWVNGQLWSTMQPHGAHEVPWAQSL